MAARITKRGMGYMRSIPFGRYNTTIYRTESTVDPRYKLTTDEYENGEYNRRHTFRVDDSRARPSARSARVHIFEWCSSVLACAAIDTKANTEFVETKPNDASTEGENEGIRPRVRNNHKR